MIKKGGTIPTYELTDITPHNLMARQNDEFYEINFVSF